MAMPELKQKLLLYELKQIGFSDSLYEPENDVIRINTGNERRMLIQDEDTVRYLQADRETALNTVKPLVDKVNELTAAWENAQTVPFEHLSRFRVLADYNNIMFAARDDTGQGRGFHFATWRYNYDRTGLEHGNYTEDYNYAKEDFAERSGLVSKDKLFTREQAAVIKASIEYRIENDGDITMAVEDALKSIAEQLNDAYPYEPENEKSLLTVTAINGEISVGDWVVTAGNSDCSYLVGEVTAIDTDGTPEHEAGNITQNVHVNFFNDDYSEQRRGEILEELGWAYTESISYDELPLGDVVVAPQALIRVTELDRKEYYKLVESRENCEAFCNAIQGGRELNNEQNAEPQPVTVETAAVSMTVQEQLYEKMKEEQKRYIGELMSQSPDRIVEKIYELAIRDELSFICVLLFTAYEVSTANGVRIISILWNRTH